MLTLTGKDFLTQREAAEFLKQLSERRRSSSDGGDLSPRPLSIDKDRVSIVLDGFFSGGSRRLYTLKAGGNLVRKNVLARLRGRSEHPQKLFGEAFWYIFSAFLS